MFLPSVELLLDDYNLADKVGDIFFRLLHRWDRLAGKPSDQAQPDFMLNLQRVACEFRVVELALLCPQPLDVHFVRDPFVKIFDGGLVLGACLN